MEHQNMQQALVEATIAEMKRVLQDPNIRVEDHALDKAGSLGDEVDGSIAVDLDMVPGGGPRKSAQHGTTTLEDGNTYLTTTISLTTPTTVHMRFTNHAKASLAVNTPDREWETVELTPEQQETLNQYATEAAFWLTGTATGALMYTDEDPDEYEDTDERAYLLFELDHHDIMQELSRQAVACTNLAKRNRQGEQPDAAYLDAADDIRKAAAKVARANQHPGLGEARKYYEAKRQNTPVHQEPTDRFYLELEMDTDTALVRKALCDAGITAPVCQPATQEHMGHVLTDEQAQEAWEEESGYSRCLGECGGQETQHHAWSDLDNDQKAAFLQNYILFITFMKNEFMVLADILEDNVQFDEVLTTRHSMP